MNWITNYVRPKIQALVTKTEVPEDLWAKCDDCAQMIFHRELESNLRVCPHCGHHMRIPVARRLELLFDEGQYDKVSLPKSPNDPLKFRDRKRYADRLKEAQAKAQGNDAMIVARGFVGGQAAVIAAFDFSFMGGSMGAAVGEALVTAAETAVAEDAALIAIPASGGARMQEGIISLMQMPRSVVAVELVKEKRLPYIVIFTDPTTGGVSASFAMLGDVAIAEPGSIIGFAGKRVIQETIRETLPEGFQRAEYLLDHGMIDMVVPRSELRARVAQVIMLLRGGRPDPGTDDAQNEDDQKDLVEIVAEPLEEKASAGAGAAGAGPAGTGAPGSASPP